MKKNLLVWLVYIVLQGVFLPLLLKLDDATGTSYILLFVLYEVLVVIDAVLGIKIFGNKK